ncbi:hypothetical protein GCM10007094_35190 [Pseudovibrio japonicus]|uniref:Uncharacterized protein n=1 Tax=Pseudovibrio japonicus TaxID=366534 RepID=A0ABQ3ESB2_9HYPH|nr:hypothetical protein GCM10007094_35190 [Pseudovibrio japonicus]
MATKPILRTLTRVDLTSVPIEVIYKFRMESDKNHSPHYKKSTGQRAPKFIFQGEIEYDE